MFLEEKKAGEQTTENLWDCARFCAWLERLPPEQEYCYVSNGHCLIALWLRANGWDDPSVSGVPNVRAHNGPRGSVQSVPSWLWRVSCDQPRTFGAALARALETANG